MRFPAVTVVLVAGALLYVLWDQLQDEPAPEDPARYTNLAASPAKRSNVVDWAVTQIPEVCAQATGGSGERFDDCVERAESRTSTCRRAIYDNFPDNVTSEAVFRDVSITMMNCLVPESGRVQP